MTKFRDKVEAQTSLSKMIGGAKLVREGQEEESKAENESQSAGDARKHVLQPNKRIA